MKRKLACGCPLRQFGLCPLLNGGNGAGTVGTREADKCHALLAPTTKDSNTKGWSFHAEPKSV